MRVVCFLFVIACAVPPTTVGEACADWSEPVCDWIDRCEEPLDEQGRDRCLGNWILGCCEGAECEVPTQHGVTGSQWAKCLHALRTTECTAELFKPLTDDCDVF